VAKNFSPRLSTRLEAVLNVLDVLPFEQPADASYALIRSKLEKAGKPIGGNDMLIAAQAMVQGHTVVTDNLGEFSRVEGLALENWLRAP
jgi:tRNA(fMet)-specific endonuclease VapC